MSVSGICEICDRPDVDGACDRCGKLVCDRHFDERTGLCVECAAAVGREPSPGERPNAPDGVDTYRF